MPLTPGETFAGYTIVRQLGTGGMGEVYLAEHPRLPRHEAIKILRRDVSADGEYRERFEREADMVARLFHPNIVGIFDWGQEQPRGGQVFRLAMTFRPHLRDKISLVVQGRRVFQVLIC